MYVVLITKLYFVRSIYPMLLCATHMYKSPPPFLRLALRMRKGSNTLKCDPNVYNTLFGIYSETHGPIWTKYTQMYTPPLRLALRMREGSNTLKCDHNVCSAYNDTLLLSEAFTLACIFLTNGTDYISGCHNGAFLEIRIISKVISIIYIYKRVESVCLSVCSRFSQKPMDRFGQNLVW